MTNLIPYLLLVVAIVSLVYTIHAARSRKREERNKQIDALREEKAEIAIFVKAVDEMAKGGNTEFKVKPLRRLLRKCRRIFDEQFFTNALAQLDLVQEKQDTVLVVSNRIQAVAEAEQRALKAAQDALTNARYSAMTFMQGAAKQELAKIETRLRELGDSE